MFLFSPSVARWFGRPNFLRRSPSSLSPSIGYTFHRPFTFTYQHTRNPTFSPSRLVKFPSRNPSTSSLGWHRSQFTHTGPEIKSFADSVKPPKVWKHITFALAVSADVYIWAAAETNKESAFWKEVLLAAPQLPGEVGERLKGLPHNNDSLRTLKRIVDMAELNSEQSSAILFGFPAAVKRFIINAYYTNLDMYDGVEVALQVVPILFAAWTLGKLSRTRSWMKRHFLHYPLSGKVYTMATGLLAQRRLLYLPADVSLFFIFVPIVAVWMKAEPARSRIQAEKLKQQLHTPRYPKVTEKYHLYAFLLTAGLLSSLCNHLFIVRFRFPRLVSGVSRSSGSTDATVTRSALRQSKPVPSIFPHISAANESQTEASISKLNRPVPSLHSAIWSCITIMALALWDVPSELKGKHNDGDWVPEEILIPIMFGVFITGWTPHHLPSHIAGALFGAVYYFYGFEFWNKLRLKCLEWQKKEKEILTAERG